MSACFAIAPLALAKGNEIKLQDCEAFDAGHLLQQFDEPYWQGKWYRLGPWRVVTEASIICSINACIVSSRLAFSSDGASESLLPDTRQRIRSVLPYHERDNIERLVFRNEVAASIRDAIADSSYELSEGEIGTVWVDYGKLARQINIRSRIEIRCKTTELHCTIDDNTIAFIPYDEHRKCGYLSEEGNSLHLLY